MRRPLVFIIIPIPPGLSRGPCSAVIPSQWPCHWRGNPSFPLWGNGLPRQSADWLTMTRCVGDGVPDVPHKTCRGERPCPPHATAAPCRAGPACPAGSNAYFAAGHMGPALRDLRLTHPPPSAKRTQIVNKCPLTALSRTKEFPFHSSKCTAARHVNYRKCVVSFINRVYRRFFHIARRNSKGV